MPRMTGARAFAEMLRGYGVDHVFFVPAIMSKALAEMEDMPIRRVMVHGEKSAAYMADGYARASGKPGVCMAQHIGASNLAAGLRDAYMAGSPVIAITGGPSPDSRYRNTYQEIEDAPQFPSVSKFSGNVGEVGLGEHQPVGHGRLPFGLVVLRQRGQAIHRIHRAHHAVDARLAGDGRFGHQNMHDGRGVGEAGGLEHQPLESRHLA